MTTEEQFNLYGANFEELYNKLLEVIENEDDNGKEIRLLKEIKGDLEIIKYGSEMRVPWYVFFDSNEGRYWEEYPHTGSIKIFNYDKYPIVKYHMEKDKRMTLMRSIIKEYDTDEPMTDPE